MKVRTGDTVMVIAGNDKGRSGTVKEVQREAGRVVIEGINLRWKHKKPSQKNPKGERIQIEIPIHASNVMHMDAKGEPTRKAPARTEKNQQKATTKAAPKGKKGR
ncbi:MAG: 50S ribosomal protein L24 [Planctomycetota bacterium]|nr:50S ribosomal protein L24 [Planctomycetota bacterium]